MPDFLHCFDFTIKTTHVAVTTLVYIEGGDERISNKIEPNAVLWNNLFFAVDMKPFLPSRENSFIDHTLAALLTSGSGDSVYKNCCPLECTYVPSSVQI